MNDKTNSRNCKKTDTKLVNYFTSYLGPNTEENFEGQFVDDYFSTIFEKVGAAKVLYRFAPPSVSGGNKVKFWEEVSKYLMTLGNIVYKHKGLLSKVDVDSLQAHWGYPIQQKKPLSKSLFDFAVNILQVEKPEHLTHLSIVLYIGQAYISKIGPRFKQTYCATPGLFMQLPSVTDLPVGISADKWTFDTISKEVGKEVKIISIIN